MAFLCTDLAWVSTELAARATGALCLERGGMVWNEAPYEPFHIQVEQLIPIGGPPGQEAMPSQGFYMSACTFNVQGIGGNHRYLEEQFEHQGYHLVMLQETKSAAGQCESSRYYRLASPADRYWGVSIWFSKRLGIFELDGTPIVPSEADLRVLVATPRLLAAQVMVGTDKIGLLAAHCPHQVQPEERDAFMRELRDVLGVMKRAQFLVCGIDLNGRLPVDQAGVTGDLEFDEPDATGTLAAEVLADMGMWAPTTFSHIHVGDSATHCHHTGAESRIDYVLLGGRAVVTEARSRVNHEIDNGSPNLDHWAVLKGKLRGLRKRMGLLRPKFDTEQMDTKEGKAIVAEACRSFRQPTWEVHPDQHCQLFQDHMLATLQKHFAKPESRKRASYIFEEVWTVRQRKQQLTWRI